MKIDTLLRYVEEKRAATKKRTGKDPQLVIYMGLTDWAELREELSKLSIPERARLSQAINNGKAVDIWGHKIYRVIGDHGVRICEKENQATYIINNDESGARR